MSPSKLAIARSACEDNSAVRARAKATMMHRCASFINSASCGLLTASKKVSLSQGRLTKHDGMILDRGAEALMHQLVFLNQHMGGLVQTRSTLL